MRNQRISILFKRAAQAIPLVLGTVLWVNCEGQQPALDTTTPTNQIESVEQQIQAESVEQQIQAQPVLHPLGNILETPDVMQAKLLPRAALEVSPAALPTSVDLSAKLPPVGDQGSQGSCTGWAVAYATKTLHEVTEMSWVPNAWDHEFSPSWIFNQLTSGGGGVGISSAMSLVVSKGCDTMSSFPYNQNDYATKPNADSMARAAHYPAKSWNTLAVNANDFKTVLAGGNTVVVGFNVLPDFDGMNGTTNTSYDTDAGTRAAYSFTANPCNTSTCGSRCNSSTACGVCGGASGTTCTVPACTKVPCSRGGHAIALVGYDDNQGAFRFINSWGSGWDGNGYGWLGYNFITNANLSLQPFVMIDGTNLPGLQDSTMIWYESSRVDIL